MRREDTWGAGRHEWRRSTRHCVPDFRPGRRPWPHVLGHRTDQRGLRCRRERALGGRGDADHSARGRVRIQQLDVRVGEVRMLAASPGRRGLGIGRELMRFVERDARQRGLETMQLALLVHREWSHPSKVLLDEWYTRIGYEVTSTGLIDDFRPELAPHLATTCDFVVYRKSLILGDGSASRWGRWLSVPHG
ncbi:GNAT family N-acetyltransferase [Streptomyces sp. NPDC054794]